MAADKVARDYFLPLHRRPQQPTSSERGLVTGHRLRLIDDLSTDS